MSINIKKYFRDQFRKEKQVEEEEQEYYDVLNKFEIKYFDQKTGFYPFPISFVWTFMPINNVSQGVESFQRIGNEIQILSIDLRMYYNLNDQSGLINILGDQIRICIVLDTQSNGLTITGTDVFTTNSYTSFQNPLTIDRFFILKDKIIESIDPKVYDNNGLVQNTKSFSIHYSKEIIDVFYQGNSSSINSLIKNSIWFGFCGVNGVSNLTYTSRIKYIDC